MKSRYIHITFVIFLQISKAIGQDFAPIGAEWYYSSSAGGAAPSRSEYYHLVVEKDTTINDINLKKIDRTYYRYIGDTVILTPYYIHQDEYTVSLYNPDINKFYRFLIFNANQGDTLTFDIPFEDSHLEDTTYRAVIDTIINEIYDGTELNKYVLEQIDEFGWLYGFYLEKVGGYEWFLPIGLVTIPEHDGPIRCYHDDQIDINFTGTDCDYREINSLNSLLYDSFKVFPNPTYDKVHFKSDFKIDWIEVIDDTGKIILRTKKTMIDLKNFENRVYILRISSNNNKIIRKVIKY